MRRSHYRGGIVSVCKTGANDTWTISGGQFNGYAKSWTAATDFPEFSTYATLYDQYKLIGVKIRIWPRATGAVLVPTGSSSTSDDSNVPSYMLMSYDYDDDTVPTNTAQLQNRSNCVWLSPYKPHKFWIRPQNRISLGGGGTTSYNAGIGKFGWIDCGFTQVRHNALKLGCTMGGPTTNTIRLDINYTVYMKFKNAH